MDLDSPIFLQRRGLLSSSRNRILDIGPQTIYHVREHQIREFVTNQGASAELAGLQQEIERLVYFSTPRPRERTTMFSEITDLTDIEYMSIDVCPGLKNTKILDLNHERLPRRLTGSFDVVFNFGTTEHIFNQWNCFEVMHDALKVDGVIYHQLPASGYLDHGYFCYTPLFFRELAQANSYEMMTLAVTHAGESRIDALGLTSMSGETLLTPPAPSHDADNRIPAFNIHVILRKTTDAAFRAPLEIATAHAPLSERIKKRYAERTAAGQRAIVWQFSSFARRLFG
jgi:SAM-dependent methyltransferase